MVAWLPIVALLVLAQAQCPNVPCANVACTPFDCMCGAGNMCVPAWGGYPTPLVGVETVNLLRGVENQASNT